jgi:hypothetical protein
MTQQLVALITGKDYNLIGKSPLIFHIPVSSKHILKYISKLQSIFTREINAS